MAELDGASKSVSIGTVDRGALWGGVAPYDASLPVSIYIYIELGQHGPLEPRTVYDDVYDRLQLYF